MGSGRGGSHSQQVARSCPLTPRHLAFPIRGRRLNLQACALRQGGARAERRYRRPASSHPKDFEGGPQALEVLVTRDQGCLPGLGEGGGEASSRVRHSAMNSSGSRGGCPCYESGPALRDCRVPCPRRQREARRSPSAWPPPLFPRVDGFTGQCYDFAYGNCSKVCSWNEWPERSGLAGYEPVPPYAAEA
jgi:hypothetical protein